MGYELLRSILRSTPQRQRHPNRHKHATTKLIESSSNTAQPRADAVGHAGYEKFGGDFDGGEGAGHDEELHEQAAAGVEELGQEGGKEEDCFRVGDR